MKGRIDQLASDPLKTLQQESWTKNCELTRAMEAVFAATADGPPEVVAELSRPADPDVPILDQVVAVYNRMHAGQTGPLRAEYEEAERELRRIGDLLIEGVPSQTVRKQLDARMSELEDKKQEIGARLTPLTLRVDSLREQLAAVRRTLEQSEKAAVAKVLDQFVEKVIPRFEVLEVGPSKSRRAILRSVEFIAKQTEAARNVLPRAMELCAAHTDRSHVASPRRRC